MSFGPDGHPTPAAYDRIQDYDAEGGAGGLAPLFPGASPAGGDSAGSFCGPLPGAPLKDGLAQREPPEGQGLGEASGRGEGLLDHLFGARFVLSLWILGDHFVHRASVLFDRANVAVDCFIVMSGFVTHWAYGERDLRGSGAVAQFYARRIGRVLLTTYLSMAVATAIMAAVAQPPEAGHLLRCACFVESWRDPEEWCPNGQTWTVAALLPSWLLYPWTRRLVAAAEARGGGQGLVALLVALWAASVGPSLLIFAAQGGWITTRQHDFAYVWPPSQFADFLAGMAAAALARRHDRGPCGAEGMSGSSAPDRAARGWMADVAVVLVLCTAFWVPSSGYHVGWEPLFSHGLAPALAAFLYGSSAAAGVRGAGVAAAVLSRWPLPQLGKYSFEVFLFQLPLFSAFEAVWIAGLDEVFNIGVLGVSFVVVLFLLSGLYAEYVEAPFVRRLRDLTAGWA